MLRHCDCGFSFVDAWIRSDGSIWGYPGDHFAFGKARKAVIGSKNGLWSKSDGASRNEHREKGNIGLER